MKKKSETNINTERITVYPNKQQFDREKQRQKTIPLIPKKQKKIMLTDLCGQQKLKIGQLIKALQSKKIQNQELTTSLSTMTKRHYQLQQAYSQIQFKYIQKQRQVHEIKQRIRLFQKQILDKSKQNQQILAIQEKQQLFIREWMDKQTKQQVTWTTRLENQDFSMQTNMIKHIDVQIQVQFPTYMETYSLMHKHHSKSFQKIMKGHWTMLENINIRSRNPVQKDHYERQWKTPNQISYSKAHQSCEVNEESEESLNESYEQLAKKWRQLKSKNPLITKNSSKSMKQSKEKRFPSISHEFRLKQSNTFQKNPKRQDFTNIDEIQLNKMLKSKDFTISKLINVKSSQRIQNSQSRSKDCKSPQMSNNIKKSPYFNYESEKGLANSHLNVEKKTILAYSDKSSKQDINFFENDIIEIADSVNHL